MASTVFTAGTVVASTWLNDVNTATYQGNSYAGVDPTGAVDSSAAVNAAIIAASAAGFRRFRLEGTYKFLSVINLISGMAYELPGTYNFNVTDVGFQIPAAATRIKVDGCGTGLIQGTLGRGIASVIGSTFTDGRISGLYGITGCTLVGAGYTGGVVLDGCTRVWVEDNRCYGNGIGVSTATGNSDIMLYITPNSFCFIRGNTCTSTLVGFNIVAYNITDSHIDHNTTSGAVCGSANNNGYGILVYSSTTDACKRVTVDNNVVANTGGTGIYIQDVVNVTVSSNVMYNVAQTQSDAGLPVGGVAFNGCTNAVSSGNLVDTSGKAGITTTGGSRVSIVGGVVKNCTGPGIYLRGNGDGTVVSGVVAEDNAYNFWSDAVLKSGIVLENVTSRLSKTGFRGIELGNVNGARLSGVSSNNARGGVVVLAGDSVTISMTTMDNGTDAANTYDGIATASSRTKFYGCRSGNTSATGQRYGINSTGNYDSIQCNDLTRNQTDGYSISGSNVMKDQNRLSTSATPGPTQGSGVLVAGTVTIVTDEIRTGDTVLLERFTAGGTQGIVGVSTITNATSFVLLSSNVADTSTYTYSIRH